MTTITAPALSTLHRLRWTIMEAGTIAGRSYRQLLAQPGQLIGFIVFPVIFTVLFGYVFGSAISLPGGGDYRQFLMPGIFVQIMALTATNAATKMAEDTAKGIVDRFKSLPIARSSVLLGRTLAEFSGHMVGLATMVACGILIAGWSPQRGIGDTVLAFLLLMLLGNAMMWVGTFLGLCVSSGATADAATFSWVFPMTFLANTFVPTGNMPAWLRAVADWNPLSATVTAVRQLFGSPAVTGTAHHAWPLEHPEVASLGWSLLIFAIFLPLAVRRYRNATAH
jgi:ABC-2 type transport system permease protein